MIIYAPANNAILILLILICSSCLHQVIVVSNAVPDILSQVAARMSHKANESRMVLSRKPRAAGVIDGLAQAGFIISAKATN